MITFLYSREINVPCLQRSARVARLIRLSSIYSLIEEYSFAINGFGRSSSRTIEDVKRPVCSALYRRCFFSWTCILYVHKRERYVLPQHQLSTKPLTKRSKRARARANKNGSSPNRASKSSTSLRPRVETPIKVA